MEHYPVIIVGGGPAGSSCAWELRRLDVDCLILDGQTFPRDKLCAGWITPEVFDDLELRAEEYPHGLLVFERLHAFIHGIRIKLKGPQYSIRRHEFDAWLLKRSGSEFREHTVRAILEDGGTYSLDDRFSCDYIVGAGGTNCPVYKTLFAPFYPRQPAAQIIALEREIRYDYHDDRCLLWFFEHKLPGYAWYVPKAGGYLNVGVGGLLLKLKKRDRSIREYWALFIDKLQRLGLVKDFDFKPQGYTYYSRNGSSPLRIGNAFIVGDAAGLATRDMGEGIGPAIRSGILSARAIVEGSNPADTLIPRHSAVWPLSRSKPGRWFLRNTRVR